MAKNVIMALADCDAVILAGGQGTRIRHLLPRSWPKCMAGVNGAPFVDILIAHLRPRFRRLLFAAGYGWLILNGYFAVKYGSNDWLITLIEREPLGTAGAILNACNSISSDPFFVFNADTWTDFDLESMAECHVQTNGLATVAVDGEMRHCGVFVFSKKIFEVMRKMDRPFSTEDLFTELGGRHETVNFYYVERPEFYDIGTPSGLSEFKAYWSKKPFSLERDHGSMPQS